GGRRAKKMEVHPMGSSRKKTHSIRSAAAILSLLAVFAFAELAPAQRGPQGARQRVQKRRQAVRERVQKRRQGVREEVQERRQAVREEVQERRQATSP
ncbi:MAG: hypothetical protein O2807_06990, partial [bacterium]|nr:hypothetical protein [bacterium]